MSGGPPGSLAASAPIQKDSDLPTGSAAPIQDSDDDSPQLSAHTLAALQEFYAEALAMTVSDTTTSSGGPAEIEENWQLSQFWYSDETAQILGEEVVRASSDGQRIACVSCPTLYSKLITMRPPDCQVILLEYDQRFQVYGEDFVYYDYNQPLELPQDKLGEHSFDLVIADPPYLSEECMTKTAQTVQYLAKDKILLCTGALMEELAFKLLGLRKCSFVPTHARNLANEFRCFANYNTQLDVLGGASVTPPLPN